LTVTTYGDPAAKSKSEDEATAILNEVAVEAPMGVILMKDERAVVTSADAEFLTT
jgi:hypothetical protein